MATPIHGLDGVTAKMRAIGDSKTVKKLARKAAREAINIVRDAARANAKAIDDKDSPAKIWKNIVSRSGKTLNKNAVRERVGVLGGASFGDGKTTIITKKEYKNFVGPINSSTVIGLTGGDTRHWRWIEFGTSEQAARPFMRPALSENTDKVTDKFVQSFRRELDAVLGVIK
ncbi:HK97 gp10 family phage protein [Acinetobacter baumannii]|nr:HK97 gp10 family phage protein [Acinetobacter baumannii]